MLRLHMGSFGHYRVASCWLASLVWLSCTLFCVAANVAYAQEPNQGTTHEDPAHEDPTHEDPTHQPARPEPAETAGPSDAEAIPAAPLAELNAAAPNEQREAAGESIVQSEGDTESGVSAPASSLTQASQDTESSASDAVSEPAAATVTVRAEASGSAYSKQQIAHVRSQLQQLELDREATNPWWPRLTIIAGGGAVLLSAAVGIAHALDCDRACRAPTWITLVVVAGALVGVLGSVWLVRTDAAVSELNLRKFQLEYELERWQRAANAEQAQRARAAFTLRFAL